jgi:electron transfer flavoprotein beta subunit
MPPGYDHRLMKIVVCVKCVPEGRARLDPESKRLDRTGAGEINTFDLYAVEEAIRIKESSVSDAEVIVVSVGPEPMVEALRGALALGADRAVLVTDQAAQGSDMLATSKMLTKVLQREDADLVLFGQQTSDGGGALLWAAVAEGLGLPAVSQTTELEIRDTTVRATRQTEVGDDVVVAPMPAIVAVTDAINELRYASLKGKMAAKKKPLEVLALSDLGVDASAAGIAGSKTEVLRIGEPPARANVVRIEEHEGAAQRIVEFLAERRLI